MRQVGLIGSRQEAETFVARLRAQDIEAEAQAQALMLMGKDHRAFYEAFKEKRPPRFTGE